jgi:hypothetical protein
MFFILKSTIIFYCEKCSLHYIVFKTKRKKNKKKTQMVSQLWLALKFLFSFWFPPPTLRDPGRAGQGRAVMPRAWCASVCHQPSEPGWLPPQGLRWNSFPALPWQCDWGQIKVAGQWPWSWLHLTHPWPAQGAQHLPGTGCVESICLCSVSVGRLTISL